MLARIALSTITCLALVGCADSDPGPLELATCPDATLRELARFRADEDAVIQVYDLQDAVTVRYARDGSGRTDLIDNCGGAPLRIPRTFGLETGAAYVGGEVVLCSGEGFGQDEGVWELRADGTAGRELGLGLRCSGNGSSIFAQLGFVFSEDFATQYLPDGTTREFTGSVTLLSRAPSPSVMTLGESPVIYPADGSAPVDVVAPTPIAELYGLRGPDDTWVLGSPISVSQADFDTPVAVHAINTVTGVTMQAPALPFIEFQERISVRDGLLVATDPSRGDIVIVRPEWDEPFEVSVDATSATVLDGERIFLVGGEALRIVRVPTELEDDGSLGELEELWSLERAEDNPPKVSGAFWNGVVLIRQDDDLWVYPLDGGAPYPAAPASRQLVYQENAIVGLADNEATGHARWLFRFTLGGGLEVLEDAVVSGDILFGGLSHRWTPQLGRLVYAVRDGAETSVRQHVLEQ